MLKATCVWFSICLIVVVAPVSVAAPWVVNHDQSVIEFSGTHAGNRFVGSFSQWTADIVFDRDALSNAKVKAIIQTGSASTGNSLYDGTLKGEDWFNVGDYAEAVFEMTSISRLNGDSDNMEGQLTLKDRVIVLKAPFKLVTNGKTALATMKFSIDRMQLGLGVKSDASASWVSKDIDLKVIIAAER